MLPARRALLSVSDKRGLAELAAGLHALGVEILSTGGTHRFLEEQGIPVLAVAEVTGFPEILDGRVKTLHPHVHGGVLADRGRASHLAQLQEHGITPIDLVVVNLYPFRETAAAPGASFAQTLEMIDIGGPCLLRGAAKNHQGVVVVVDPDDYPQVLAALESGGGRVPEPVRRRLAVKAFRHTQACDAAIAAWLEGETREQAERFPRHLTLDLVRELELRYGENPHQAAALFRVLGAPGALGGMRQLQGKELSYNNLLDADAARRLVALFAEPAAAIVKHNNPCGVALGSDPAEAFARALATDPVSAFGSIVALNRAADRALAQALGDLFVEVLVAPGFDEDALALLAARRALRLVESPVYRPRAGELELRAVDGGLLAQEPDAAADDPESWSCATRREPSAAERRALAFAWNVARHVKSNAIVVAAEGRTLAIGAGQMSRVDACRLALDKALQPVTGGAAASDAFFPFRDGLDVLAAAGIAAVVQPGGSKRDAEVIAAADEHGMAMLLTGTRHFRH